MTSESSSNFDDFKDLEALLDLDRERERELNIYRSGSAPPTVEGSRTAIRSLLGHNNGESFLSDPDYLSYYYSNDTLKNPRMPPPLVSREDWRVVERFSNGNSVLGDRRKKGLENGDGNSSNSLFSVQPGLKEEEWRNGGLIGLGCRRKSFKDVVQEDAVHLPPVSPHPSRPVSRNAYGISNDLKEPSDVQFAQVHNDMNAVGGLRPGTVSPGLVRVQSFGSGTISPGLVRVQNLGSTMSQSFASAVGSSPSRSTTPDPHVIGRSSRHGPHLSERMINAEKRLVSNGFGGGGAAHVEDIGDVVDALSNLNISNNIKGDGESHVQGQLHHQFTVQTEGLYNAHNDHNKYSRQKIMINPDSESLNVSALPSLVHNGFSKNTGIKDFGASALASNGKISLQEQFSSMNLSNKVTAMGSKSLGEFSGHYLKQMANVDFGGHDSNAFQTLPARLNNHLNEGGDVSSGSGGQYLSRSGNRIESSFQAPVMDPLYAQYLQRASDYATDLSDPTLLRSYLSTNHMDMSGYNKAYLGALLAQQRLPQETTYLGKPGDLNNGFYGNSGGGLHLPFPTLIHGNSVRQNDPLSRLSSTLRSGGGYKGSWNNVNGIMDQGFASTLLEEFKANKTRSFELSEIADHVVEFSGDQYGSRFIQQKLETASVEEKNKLFPEILAHARVLMTDVFGNYVIQKFFEHGTESQRHQLAGQLMGHVLSLSLQMYGCRVIQKALEVVDVEQQTRMVSELDGSIMKCVRDQNGNHVIQKCIECVPEERIQFIVSSFYGQVVALSTHPYGCRVIQRVLEHCKDVKTQSIMMDEIMRSVCILAQDQYGNYVIQHVLQHGKQEERAVIISKLAGQIVKMSQQKFASNVVEKCLTFGSPAERQLLIDEMLGSTDENEPLQAMMKDQFGNYVVQKVLETCDDQNRELILSRVRVHLNALKRYTYGKHIVARVEKLITAGERRIGMPSHAT